MNRARPMSKSTITRLFAGALVAVAAGLVLVLAAVLAAVASDPVVTVTLVVAGSLALIAGGVGGMASWIGALLNTAQLEGDTFVPNAANHITVTGGGPSGVVLNEAKNRLYVFTRFDNGVSIVDTTTNTQIGHLQVQNPEPASVVAGRPVLYDAVLSSSNGEASCSSSKVVRTETDGRSSPNTTSTPSRAARST